MKALAALDSWHERATGPGDDADERLVEQAAFLFEHAAVHLPERRAAGIDPVARLRSVQAAMPGVRSELYRELLAIFAEYGDRHSRFVPPPPWSDHFAYLPFVVGACVEAGETMLLVTVSACAPLRAGDRLVSWNGRPVGEVLRDLTAWQLGANPAARLAKAVQTLTVRPLALLPPPEGEVELVVEGAAGRASERLRWQVGDAARLGRDLAACLPDQSGFEAAPCGLFGREVRTSAGPIAWIRIPSLRAPAAELLPALAGLLDQLPRMGLVLDLRGCEEGLVQTGERMLGLFADRPLAPLRFEMRTTDWLRELVRTCPALAEWRGPLKAGVAAGRPWSEGRPLTPPELLAAPARRYPGPLLVLVDALTFSTAEMFAAGVQDHGLGKVLGVAPRTGGGGGSAWSLELFHRLSGDDRFARAPGTGSLRMAVLRCRRTGPNAGRLIEGEGIVPDFVHEPSRRDLLRADENLVERAARLLGEMR